jgi:hypothetical protein
MIARRCPSQRCAHASPLTSSPSFGTPKPAMRIGPCPFASTRAARLSRSSATMTVPSGADSTSVS